MYFGGVESTAERSSDMECLLARNTLWRVTFAEYCLLDIASKTQKQQLLTLKKNQLDEMAKFYYNRK